MIKWHDLTKHPDDLPKDGTDVIAILRDIALNDTIDMILNLKGGKWNYTLAEGAVESEEGVEILKWAYIESEEDTPKPSPKKKVMGLRKRLMDDIFNINMRVCENLKFIKGYESDFPLGETTLAVKGTLAQVESKIESAFADYERGEKCD